MLPPWEEDWMLRIFGFGLLLAFAAPATAGEPEPPIGRYAFVPTPDGALRLDTETGEVSLCITGERAPSCTRVSENVRLTVGERAKLEAAIAQLETRVATLEARERATAMPAADQVAMGRVKTLAARAMQHLAAAVGKVKHDLRGEL